MATPTLTLAATGTNGTATTSHVVDLPAGTADKVIWFLAFESTDLLAPGATATDWTVAKTYAISQAQVLYVLTRVATSETSVTITTVESSYSAWVGGSTDGDIANAVFTDGVTGSGATNDPDAVTVTSGDYRVGAMVAYRNGSRALNGYPTNYTDNQVNPRIAGSSRPGLGLATRGLTGITSEDPGPFDMHGGSGANIAATMAIPEAGGGGVSGTANQAIETSTAQPLSHPLVVAIGQALDTSTAQPVTKKRVYPGNLPDAAVIAFWDAQELVGSDTDPVSSWPDLGPNTEDPLAQATGTKQPTIDDSGFGGVRSVLFDGVDDFLTMALAASHENFAIVAVLDPLTYPTGSAAVPYSTGFIGSLEKNILGIDDVEAGFPNGAWVVMSGPEGTQAEHHHGTNFALDSVIPGKQFVMSQAVRNAGGHRLWENSGLVIDEADSAQGDNLNNLAGMRLGAREDESRHFHGRVGAVLLIDLDVVGDAEILDAATDLSIDFNVAGFGIIPIGQAVESGVAQALVAAKVKAVGQATSVAMAQTLTAIKQRSIGLATQSEVAQALAVQKALEIGLVTETDLAQSFTAGIIVPIGQVVGVEVAQPLVSTKALSIGFATELDQARGVGVGVGLGINQASETDTASELMAQKVKAIGQAISVSTAISVNALRARTIGQALSISAARPVTPSGTLVVAIGQAVETDTAIELFSTKVKVIGQAVSLALAQPVVPARVYVIGQAASSSFAQPLSWTRAVVIGQAVESDVAQPVLIPVLVVIGQAIETDTALGVVAVGVTVISDIDQLRDYDPTDRIYVPIGRTYISTSRLYRD